MANKVTTMSNTGNLTVKTFRMNDADIETVTVKMFLWLGANTISSVAVETSGCSVTEGNTTTEVTLQVSNVSGRAVIHFTVTDSAGNKIKRSIAFIELHDDIPTVNPTWYYC